MWGSRVVVSATRSETRFRMLRASGGQGAVLTTWHRISLIEASCQHFFLDRQNQPGLMRCVTPCYASN